MKYFYILGRAGVPERYWTIEEITKEVFDKFDSSKVDGYVQSFEKPEEDRLLKKHFTVEQLN